MRTTLRFASTAIVAGLIGLSPALAQEPARDQPKPEAELKKAKEQLERLLQDLRDQEAKKAKDAPRVVSPAPAAVPAPPPPPATRTVWATPASPADPTAALKPLLASKDPKTAALAKELLEQLSKSAPKPGGELRLELGGGQKPGGSLELELKAVQGKPGEFEFKLEPGARTAAVPMEFKVIPAGDGPRTTERRDVVVTKMASANAPAAGSSTLRLSADGKTAAVIGSDGTVTIYDVASGKEQMKFPGKK